MRISSAAVHRIAEESVLHRISNRRTEKSRRRFVAAFGINPRVVASIWNRIQAKDLAPDGMLVKHLLWALYFLKTYQPEAYTANRCQVDENTYWKWLWIVLDVLGELDLVSQSVGRIRHVCESLSFVD